MMENETVGFLFAVRQLFPEGVEEAAKWLLREVFGFEGCIFGPDKTCPPDAPTLCEACGSREP